MITNEVTSPPPPEAGTLRVIKTVVNDSGTGSALASAFNLHVKFSGAEVTNSPAVGVVSPGRSYTLTAGTYVVSG